MSAARLPLPYRDSCAHLLIPLNRCRQEEFYLPWKCEVRRASLHWAQQKLTAAGRATLLRKVPVRGVQAAGGQDGRAAGSQERRAEQLSTAEDGNRELRRECCMYISTAQPTSVNMYELSRIQGGPLRYYCTKIPPACTAYMF